MKKNLNLSFLGRIFLVSFHPETLKNDYGLNGFDILLSSLDKFKNVRIIFTGTNPDILNQKILIKIKKFISKNKIQN